MLLYLISEKGWGSNTDLVEPAHRVNMIITVMMIMIFIIMMITTYITIIIVAIVELIR